MFFSVPELDLSQGWVLTLLLSLLCVLGCFIIFLDDIYYLLFPRWITNRYPFVLKENFLFMNGSLAFSAGCLCFTALYRLLPEALVHFKKGANPGDNNNLYLVASFIGGIAICVIFNVGLHMLTTESVVHCSHDGEDSPVDAEAPRKLSHSHSHHSASHNHGHSQKSSHGHSHSHDQNFVAEEHGLSSALTHSHTHDHMTHDSLRSSGSSSSELPKTPPNFEEDEVRNISESTALVSKPHTEYHSVAPPLTHKKSLVHFLTHGTAEEEDLLGECKGYSSAELCHYQKSGGLHFCEVPQLRKHNLDDEAEIAVNETHRSDWDGHSHHDPAEHHHHHVNSPMSRLLLIGIQTILAITLHKFPEGFITYITLKTNPQLGVSIFLSLLIHNYTEGFLMCLPLYYSFGESRWRKWKAVSISAFLGGLSQPAGAFVGYLFIKHLGTGSIDVNKLNFVFGVSMAMTAGFLTVIAMSMYGSAVSFSGLPTFVCYWSLIGMCTIGILSVLTNRD